MLPLVALIAIVVFFMIIASVDEEDSFDTLYQQEQPVCAVGQHWDSYNEECVGESVDQGQKYVRCTDPREEWSEEKQACYIRCLPGARYAGPKTGCVPN
jgi:hypothetical protein